MTPATIIVLSSVTAVALGLAVTPLVRQLALRWRLTDDPDGHRKLQTESIPLGGGISVLLSMWGAALAVFLLAGRPYDPANEAWLKPMLGLLAASVAIVALGLIDDRVGLRGRHKLFGQIAISAGLMNCGYLITSLKVFGLHVDLGLLALPVTLGWLLLAINSLNLIDGVDGLASTVGIILSATLGCLAYLSGHNNEAYLLAGLAGALLGFLKYNFPPARMYLGDAGSMLIGLVLGAVSIAGALKGPTAVALTAPIAVWAVPLLDTGAALVRRKLTGRSIYAGDRGHLHHCLYQISGSARGTLYLIVLACTATCFGAIVSIAFKSDLFALISVASVAGVLVATRSFGFGELQLIVIRVRDFAQSLVPFQMSPAVAAKPDGITFQGSRSWNGIWQQLVALAEELNVDRMCLDVNIPVIQENFHATWSHEEVREPAPAWSLDIPLCVNNHRWGRMLISGPHDGISSCVLLAKLMDQLEPLESQFQQLVSDRLAAAPLEVDRRAKDRTITPSRPHRKEVAHQR